MSKIKKEAGKSSKEKVKYQVVNWLAYNRNPKWLLYASPISKPSNLVVPLPSPFAGLAMGRGEA